MVKTIARTYVYPFIFLVLLVSAPIFCQAQVVDANALLVDIPEPPGARSELPSPVPMVYEFMGGVMDGEYDKCLSNFHVRSFLEILFGRQLSRLSPAESQELYSYQVQTHRNEFRFLAGIMNRVAKGAKISYSDPRYHKKVQAKIVIRLHTTKGKFEFVVYCRFAEERWWVYDYILNGQRLSHVFRSALKNVRVNTYTNSLKPFYKDKRGFRPIRNKEYDLSIYVPNTFKIKEKVSPALLAAVSAFGGQFLLHIQAAQYDEPQTLSQVGQSIKDSLMPFQPRLYDQWKSELAGVEIGHVLFHFLKGGKRLYTHMVIVPLGKKLIVLNFYHNSLQMLKHMTNLREKMIESLALPKIEASGGVLPGEFPDEITLNASNDFGSLESGNDFGGNDIKVSSDMPSELEPPSGFDVDDDNYVDEFSDPSNLDPGESEIPPPTEDEAAGMLTPDSYGSGGGNDDYPEPPPPPPLDDEDMGVAQDNTYGGDDEIPPPPPPGSYGDGSGSVGGDDDDYFTPEPGEGSEVSF